jgi:hypothetical protein
MFPKKSEIALRAFSASSVSSPSFSVLGADVAIKGNISAQAELHIDGRIDGDIACASLVQGEGSEIVGAITTESARLAGRIKGSITAGELVILKSAHIEGDVFYDALTIEQGAHVQGNFAHREPEPKLALAGGIDSI